MKIKSLRLKNFKRFTDLTLQNIPEDAKLILLIGNNGSGKSSVFDAFEALSRHSKGQPTNHQLVFQTVDKDIYYRKNQSNRFEITIDTGTSQPLIVSEMSISGTMLPRNAFYGRTSFRQIPLLTRRNLGGARFDFEMDDDRPAIFVDRDNRFENDIEKISGYILDEVFKTNQDTRAIREKYIDPINSAFANIFGNESNTNIKLTNISPPLEGKVAKILFQKGASEFHYNQLSAGEKEVFNILLNLIARRDYFQNTIYFFDEIDLHLNTRLQYNFIKEITENWIPDNCQFWTASHSLGFIQYAKESRKSVIFDFDDYDFDQTKILTPEPKDSSKLYNIAVDEEILPFLFQDKKIFFVERNDQRYYSLTKIEGVAFIPAYDKKSVYHKSQVPPNNGIIDRDFLTDEDILEIEKQYVTLKILRYYSIENYLYHPSNLEEYYNSVKKQFSKQEYINSLTEEKNKVSDELKVKIASIRQSFPFFSEPDHEKKPNQKRFRNAQENFDQTKIIYKYMGSNDFEEFYKVFPMKDYARQLKERQAIAPSDLAKTKWFKEQIQKIIN